MDNKLPFRDGFVPVLAIMTIGVIVALLPGAVQNIAHPDRTCAVEAAKTWHVCATGEILQDEPDFIRCNSQMGRDIDSCSEKISVMYHPFAMDGKIIIGIRKRIESDVSTIPNPTPRPILIDSCIKEVESCIKEVESCIKEVKYDIQNPDYKQE